MKKYKLIWGLLFLLLLAARLLLHQSRYKDDSLGSNSSSLNFDFDKLEDFGYLLKANCYIAYASNGEDTLTIAKVIFSLDQYKEWTILNNQVYSVESGRYTIQAASKNCLFLNAQGEQETLAVEIQSNNTVDLCNTISMRLRLDTMSQQSLIAPAIMQRLQLHNKEDLVQRLHTDDCLTIQLNKLK